MNKTILIVAHLDEHINAFHKPIIKSLSDRGWIIDVASFGKTKFGNVRNKFDVSISRRPFKFRNIKAIRQLRKIINKNKYSIIHSHTPMGGAVARIANNNANSFNIYTAHGFHFFKGSPIINWVLYYPVEKYLSRKTDLILTINDEDYRLAKKKFKHTKIAKINGVGIEFEKLKIDNYNSNIFRNSLGIKETDFVITSIGELNNNKNQIFAIKNIGLKIKENSKIKYLVVGNAKNKKKYERYIKRHKLSNNIFLLGYKSNIPEILNETDLVISTSKREGLPLNILEAQRMKKIILASEIRGHTDLISNNENGFLFQLNDKNEFLNKLDYIIKNYDSLSEIANKAYTNTEKYDIKKLNDKIISFYNIKNDCFDINI